MRIAVLSDIHANSAALAAVLSDVDKQQADEVWVLGDVLGYGPNPEECLQMLEALGPDRLTAWIMGNHDAWWHGLPGMDEQAGADPVALRALQRQAGKLRPRYREDGPGWGAFTWEPQQFRTLGGADAIPTYLVHGGATRDEFGGARMPWEHYVRDTDDVALLRDRLLEEHGRLPALCLSGHTHMPRWYAAARDGEGRAGPPALLPLADGDWDRWLPLDVENAVYFINVGSAGMPRRDQGRVNPDLRVSYALLDDRERRVTFRRLEYPDKDTVCALQKKGFGMAIIERFQGTR